MKKELVLVWIVSKIWYEFNQIFGFYRSALAALHWNANAQREQAVAPDGEQRYKVVYPKAKHGEATLKVVKEEASYGKEFDDIKLAVVMMSAPAVNINKLTTAL